MRNGPAWSPDGTSILFVTRRDQLGIVPAVGGTVTVVQTADQERQQVALSWPRFLPDGHHYLYFAHSPNADHQGVYVAALDSTAPKLVLRSDFRAWYAAPGFLVFPREEVLIAQPFDLGRLVLYGEPTPVAEGVWFARTAAQASFSVSDTGALAYVNGSLWNSELSWFDRTGRPLGSLAAPGRFSPPPRVSPDGLRVAIGVEEFGRGDIGMLSGAAPTLTRVTFSPQSDGQPIWAADARRMMFTTGDRVHVKDIDSGEQQIVLEFGQGRAVDWSRDGRFIVLERGGQDTDIWVARTDLQAPPVVFEDTPFNEAQAQLSPDGRWIAYTANETGRDEVYVQTFPVPGRKRQISSNGGAMPRWRQDGRELFYVAADQFITAIPIGGGDTLQLGPPAPLFRTRLVVQGSESQGMYSTWDLTADAQRFLLMYPPTDPGSPITVVLNWTAALRR